MKIYETIEDLKSGNLSSQRMRVFSFARRLCGGLPVFLALTIAVQAQTTGSASYQKRSDAALQRRQLANMTQDLVSLRETLNQLRFDLEDVKRQNLTLRQKVVELQRAQVNQPKADLRVEYMEKILSGFRAQIYQEINKLEGKFFTSLDDMQKQMNTALNEVSVPPVPVAPAAAPRRVPAAPPRAVATPAYEKYYEHVVAKGDTLFGIARQYKQYKVRLSDIKAANNITEGKILKVGQKLILPVQE